MSSPDWLGLAGKKVLVAGAGGLGSAVATGFAEAAANVLVIDRDEERLEKIAVEPAFQAAGGHTLVADLSTGDSGTSVVEHALKVLGGLDVVVHSIGINDRRPVLDFSEEDWWRIVDTNLSTGFRLAQAAGRHMLGQKDGRIIFFSSVSGLLAHKNHAPYAATKGGINQLMRVMAAEWAGEGITVNAVAPGYVETPLTEAYLDKPGVRENLVSLVPAGRLGTPDEVVGPILFLASPHASFVTGHVMYIDGGRTLV
ncbi:SDR family NAD(P)-dependent oxidoreductase [Arthrobacter sp. MI7-26]|uniref:SDR family NAD(P)-dependent oxidoreductase n=1 Tax=Arthrobacter sp. MI7-26 TaxID=2993653 RepID=UPI00224921B7|nr:SDR family oxidoreductase [Arthrobacter sp. MI7-26]MCX2746817.1 SDR family NAD(P)-dependent oxidoreductase [Arthrobacter sp. MI7-26]